MKVRGDRVYAEADAAGTGADTASFPMPSNLAGARLLLTSLHQSIGAVLPERLPVYEVWLTPTELRKPTDAAASVAAVLTALQAEGSAFDVVTKRAGECTRPRARSTTCAR